MSILNILLLLSILTLSPLTHALEEALGTPTTVTSSPIAVPIAQADPATLIETAWHLREAKPTLFAGALGVLIVKVVPGSQAAEKGLQPGDIVIAYAGEAMNSADQLHEAIQAKASQSEVGLRFIRGEKVEVVVLRGGKVGVELKNILSKEATKFLEPLQAALQAKDSEKVIQLIRDNPKLAKGVLPPKLLAKLGQLRPELDRLQKEGEEAYYQSNYPLALKKWQAGLDQARQLADKRYISLFLTNLGLMYNDLDQYSKALEYDQQALAIHKELGDKHGEGSDLGNLGGVYVNLDQYSKALEYFQQALAIFRELGDKRGEGSVLTNLGVVYDNLGPYSKSLEYYQQALAIFKELGDKYGEMSDLTNLGVTYDNLSQYHKALEYEQQALAIAKELGNKNEEGHNLTNLGRVYLNLGQFPQALKYLQQALAIAEELGDKRGEASDLTNFGVVYWYLGQYPKALEYYQRALAIDKKHNDKRGEGNDLINLGMVYLNLGQSPKKALECFQQALAIAKELDDKRGEGIDLGNLGLVYWYLGQYPKALEYDQQALAISKELDDKRGEGRNLTNLGVVYLDSAQYDKAKRHFEDSITILESLGSLDTLWKAQRGLASTEVHLKQPKDAIQHYEQALNTIEQLRVGLTGGIEKATDLPARTLKTYFMQDKFFVYDELINLYHDQGDDQKAFETFERKQGRVFLEDMAKSGVRRYVGVPVAISEKEETLETQVEAAFKIQGEAAGKGDEAVKQADEQVATAKTARDAFQAELKFKYPPYYALKHPQPVKLPDLQQNVLQDGELLLIYNVRKEATDLWLVGKHHFQMFSLPVTEAQVKEQVAKFRQAGVDSILKAIKEAKDLAEEDRRTQIANAVEDSLPGFLNISHALYQQLLPESVQQLLKAAKPNTLYFVPTGALYSLPFEALVTEKGESPHYLIQDYAVSYLSSASLLKTLRDAKQPRHTEAQQPLLAFAHPVYDKTAFAQLRTEDSFLGLRTQAYLKLVGGGESFPELPETAQEATGIAKVLKADEHYLKLRKEASKQQVLEEQHLDNFQYVLFAAHAVAPEKVTPIEQPALILSLTTPDQDAYLTMADVFGLSLKADLVTLSACNTGQGELVHGEGVLGLTRAFMYAGTPAVSVTLWKIETHSSQALTTGLFTQLQQKQPLAAGLRQTKLNLLTGGPEEYYRHPYFWAGMVVFGDGK